MTFKTHSAAGMLAGMVLGLAGPAPALADPIGTWLTEKGDARVRIARCGAALCGTVAWLRDPTDPATGRPQIDDKNPDPAKRMRRIMGLQILSGMRPVAPGRWTGQIYNADDGKTYEGNIIETSAATIKVEGCLLTICMGETWQRLR